MLQPRAVWTWLLDDLIGLAPGGDDEISADAEYAWVTRTYATDVVNRGNVPGQHSVLIGFTRTGGGRILTLGSVDGLNGAATGRVRITVNHLLHITPLSAAELVGADGTSWRGTILEAAPLKPRLLTAGESSQVLAAMANLRPEIGSWLAARTAHVQPIYGSRGQTLREERDAIETGIDLAGFTPSEPILLPPAAEVEHATSLLNPEVFEDNEDDLLFADLRRFDATGVLEATSASTSRYRDGAFELQIANVNRKPIEKLYGVDLLYWDRVADSYTLLQYKRLEKSSGGASDVERESWSYTREQDLAEQLHRMEKIGPSAALNARDWRIVQNPFWFKFVRTDAFDPNDARVLRGMYVPSDYLRVGIQSKSFRGPRGGFRIGYDNVRYVPREPFIELVRRGYSGSTSANSAEITAAISAISSGRELVVVSKAHAPRPG